MWRGYMSKTAKCAAILLVFLFFGVIFSCIHNSIDLLINTNSLSVKTRVVENNTLTVDWERPSDKLIQSYVLEITDSITHTTITRAIAETETSYRIALPVGHYTVKVSIKTADGTISSQSTAPIDSKIKTGATQPAPPTDLKVENLGGNAAGVELSWTAPNAGKDSTGQALGMKEYIVYWAEGSSVDATSTQKQTLKATAQQTERIAVTGLSLDDKYSFIVLAVNTANLQSIPSDVITTTISQATKPGAPGNVQATDKKAADSFRNVALTWDAPTQTGTKANGTPSNIKEYIVYWAEGDSVSANSSYQKTTTDRSYTVPFLEQRTQYSFIVVAVNEAGVQGPASDAKTMAAWASDAPDAPTNLSVSEGAATGDTRSITLKWIAPRNAGKNNAQLANIAKYIVYWAEGDIVSTDSTNTKTVSLNIQGTVITNASITTLKWGTKYSFIVVSVNDIGKKSIPSSVMILKGMEKGAPGIPTNVEVREESSATDGTRTIELGWTEPGDKGKNADGTASSIKQYSVYWAEGESVTTSSTSKRTIDAKTNGQTVDSTAAITGLAWDKKYSFIVVAINDADKQSKPSSVKTIPASTAGAPAIPLNVLAKNKIADGGGRNIVLSWDQSATPGTDANNVASTIERYIVYGAEGDLVDADTREVQFAVDAKGITKTSLEIIISNFGSETQTLNWTKRYSFIVLAVNAADKRSIPSAILTVEPSQETVPGVATGLSGTNVEANDKKRNVRLNWTAPADKGKNADGTASKIKEYIVYWAEGERVDTSSTSKLTIDAKTNGQIVDSMATITDLAWDKKYSFIVVALNQVDATGAASAVYSIDQSNVKAPAKITLDVSDATVSPADRSIRLQWLVPSKGKQADGTTDATKITYNIYVQEGNTVNIGRVGPTKVDPATQKLTEVTGEQITVQLTDAATIVWDKQYSIIITAVNEYHVEGEPSEIKTVNANP